LPTAPLIGKGKIGNILVRRTVYIVSGVKRTVNAVAPALTPSKQVKLDRKVRKGREMSMGHGDIQYIYFQ